MSMSNFTFQEIKKIVEPFPDAAQEFKLCSEAFRLHDTEFEEYICAEGMGDRFLRQYLFDLCRQGYLDVRFSLLFKPRGEVLEEEWEEKMKKARVSDKDTIQYHFDSEKMPPPEGMGGYEWEELKQRARINFRSFLLASKVVTEDASVNLDSRPSMPELYSLREKPTDFFPIELWELKEQMIDEKPEQYLNGIQWEVRRTPDCGQRLKEKERQEIMEIDVLKAGSRSLASSSSKPKKQKREYPSLNDPDVRQRILDCCGSLPESIKEKPGEWLKPKDAATVAGVKTTHSLRSMRGRGKKFSMIEDNANPKLNGILIRDESGRIAYKRAMKDRDTFYWIETLTNPTLFWEKNFHPDGKTKRKKST